MGNSIDLVIHFEGRNMMKNVLLPMAVVEKTLQARLRQKILQKHTPFGKIQSIT